MADGLDGADLSDAGGAAPCGARGKLDAAVEADTRGRAAPDGARGFWAAEADTLESVERHLAVHAGIVEVWFMLLSFRE